MQSCYTSKGGSERRTGEIAIEETEPRPITVPSAGDRAMASVPMVPPAPARFSTTKDWPVTSASSLHYSRSSVSTPPTGAKGVMKRTGIAGQGAWACEMPGMAAVASRLRRWMNMGVPLLAGPSWRGLVGQALAAWRMKAAARSATSITAG